MSPGRVLESAPWSNCIFNGTWAKALAGTVDVKEPATGEVLTRSGLAGAADVAAAAITAAAAQPAWARTSFRERVDLFHRAASFLEKNSEEFGQIIGRETGGPPYKGLHEVREVIMQIKVAAGLMMQPDGVTLPSANRLSIAKRVPLGVVGVIAPFNFPLILSMRSVAPALALGNAVIVKPPAETPLSGGYLAALAFQEAGLPTGLFHVLPGGAEAGEALCKDPHVQLICFTGSTATGRRIGEVAGKHLKKVALELGGKNSLIILDDADLDLAAKNAAFGAYLHQGQICMATGRVLVHQKVMAPLVERLVEKAKHLPVGDPRRGLPIGPLMNERQRDHVHAIVTEAVNEGAKLEAGGTYDGLFYSPTVLTGVRASMRAFREEVFGPVANVISFASDEEAVALANDTEYGLATAVISRNVGRALSIAERINAGHVHVNDQTVADEVLNPFGGPGASGNHTSMGGVADPALYTQWRWITIKDAPPPYPY
jgi:benzaldehyde dehydrogenase (NAD)